MHRKISVAIIGLGYWGPNWLRNFAAQRDCVVKYVCDVSQNRLDAYAHAYPSTVFTDSYETLLNDPELELIAIVTPTSSHFSLAKQALEAGKHVLIEKPMTQTASQAQSLIELAGKQGKLIFVDHTFAFSPAVEEVEKEIRKGTLGNLLFFESSRINLGIIQPDTNVLWDLAIHDLSILSRIVPLHDIETVTAIGHAHFGRQLEDAHLHLHFSTGFHAHVHVSWISPVKIRQTFIAGTKAMISYDDTQPSEKVRLYHSGVEKDTSRPDPFFPKYRSGNIVIPYLQNQEALAREAAHIIECIQGKGTPRVSGQDGFLLLRILEQAEKSLDQGGIPVSI